MEFEAAEKISRNHGDDFYIIDMDRFTRNFTEMRSQFRDRYKNSEIAYSYKTNYTPDLCRVVQRLGGYAEVVSAMEYHLARRLGIPGDRTIYNGPSKSADSFRHALFSGAILNLDSQRDLEMLQAAASERPDETYDVALRCNFALSTGNVSRFGFDVDDEIFDRAVSTVRNLTNVSLCGLHCHFPDRDLAGYVERAKGLVALSRRIFGSDTPKFLNIGGGFLGRLPESLVRAKKLTRVSFDEYATAISDVLNQAFRGAQSTPQLILEPGTALVADTMRFYTRVLDVKSVRGRRFATVSGSIFSISPVARNIDLPVRVLHEKRRPELSRPHTIVGFTCIEGDVLSTGLDADIRPGDILEFGNVGSYSIVMKPPFILPASPVLLDAGPDSSLTLCRRRETYDYVFENFSGV